MAALERGQGQRVSRGSEVVPSGLLSCLSEKLVRAGVCWQERRSSPDFCQEPDWEPRRRWLGPGGSGRCLGPSSRPVLL